MAMIENLTYYRLEQLLENALINKEPIFINQNHKLEKYYSFYKDKSYFLYLELLSQSLCTEDILSKHSGLRLHYIKELNKILSDKLLEIEYYDDNNFGCNVYYFRTLNVELHNKFKDIYK
jgi:hypothetical protein